MVWLLASADAAVWMFFLLSGYVLTLGWDGRLGLFLARRFVRLWPVYALCLAAGYGVAGVRPVWSEFLWFPLIGPNDQPSIDPPVWSLFLEVWTMPFMPLIVWAGSGTGRPGALRAALCATAMLALAALTYLQFLAPCAFVAGAFLARYGVRNRWLESALPQWLGRVSYSLYLSHFVVLSVATRTFGPWGGVAAAPLAFAVAWLVWRTVERPSIAASRRLRRLFPPDLNAARPLAAAG